MARQFAHSKELPFSEFNRPVKCPLAICPKCFANSVPHNTDRLTGTAAGELFGTDPYLMVPACDHNKVFGDRVRCPLGRVGDIIFIQEKWQPLAHGRDFGVEIHYGADGTNLKIFSQRKNKARIIEEPPDRDDKYRPLNWGRWWPASTMPYWASRVHLEIIDVRVSAQSAGWFWAVSWKKVEVTF